MVFDKEIITILLVVLATCITRFLPFILFRNEENTPAFIQKLSQSLPYACMGLLVIYCLKDIQFTQSPYGLCELISIVFVIVLHLWKRNVLLSISLSTFVYVILLQIL